MSLKKRALITPKNGLSSITLNDEGEFICNKIGIPEEDACSGEDYVVIYQKGLIPKDTGRSYKAHLSNFKLRTSCGMVNVPWNNFAWLPERCKRIVSAKCKTCSSENCMECLKDLSDNNVMVIWIHGPEGQRIHQWYFARDTDAQGRCYTLTRIPPIVIPYIIANSNMEGWCNHGWCNHPLTEFVGVRCASEIEMFERRAFACFSAIRTVINNERSMCKSGKRPQKATSFLKKMKEGTCAVCLNDTMVSDGACVQELCKIEICADCHVRTSGLCPVCDRYLSLIHI